MNFVLTSDSTTDITADMAKELQVDIISLKFTIEDKTYSNDLAFDSMPIKDFYQKLRDGNLSSTSQINANEFEEFFVPYLEQGKDILHISFSSGLSGTYQSSKIAQTILQERYPERKIIIVDSLCASMGEGLLVYYAATKKAEGMDIDELASWLEKNKLHLCHLFTVNDLNHLKRGGRVSAAAALVGTVLGIKPVLHVDDEGHLIPLEKVRGRKQSLVKLVDKFKETAYNINEQTIFISHGDCLEDAQFVAELINKDHKPKDIIINTIGPVIGAHSGPGTVALFFIGSHR